MAGYIGTQAVSVNTTSATISDDLSVGDDLTVTDDAAIGGTLGVTGVVTANAGVVVDNFTLDGTTLALSSGDFTVDVAGDIRLNADGGQIHFEDAGVAYGLVQNSSSDFLIEARVQDKKILFAGNDGGANVTALTLDMANSGAATFNTDVILGNAKAILFGDGSTRIIGDGSAETIKFFTSNAERARFLADGTLVLGTTGNVYGGADRFGFNFFDAGGFNSSVNDTTAHFVNIENLSATRAAFTFSADRSTKGTITVSSSATAYNTSSDYRLKTDAQPMTGASDRVLALKPVNFKWIAGGTRVDGFLAHEAQVVVPEAVTGTKDAMMDEEYEVTPAVLDDDGNETKSAVMRTRSVPDMQGIDQSKIVPLLVAALQEALARITVLENA